MSTETPPKVHRHTRSSAIPSAAASLQNPQNPHHLHAQAHNTNSQPQTQYPVQPSTPPRTPRRDIQNASQVLQSSIAQEHGSKQRARNKNRPKNVMTSPGVTRKDRNTPPLTGAQSVGLPSSTRPISTTSTAAYAGPTFHASPAPSALPIPSFYSKSVPDSPGMKGIMSLKEEILSSTKFTPPPAVTPARTDFQREESPLDLFFKADREEKARARSAAQTSTAAIAPFQPPVESPRNSQTPPALASQDRSRPRHVSRISASGMFAMELEAETPMTPMGPAFSTPYAERINAARSSNQASGPLEQSPSDPQVALDRSEALKAYLFSGHLQQSTTSSGANAIGHTSPLGSSSAAFQRSSAPVTGSRNTGLPSQPNNSSFSHEPNTPSFGSRAPGRSSGLRQEVTPTKTPIRTSDGSNRFANSPAPPRTYGKSSDRSNLTSKFPTQPPSPSPASPSNNSCGNRTADILGMEDSLRKILKLDSAGSSGVTAGSLSSATVSGPNYVGGRPPPMNGMHNGIMGS